MKKALVKIIRKLNLLKPAKKLYGTVNYNSSVKLNGRELKIPLINGIKCGVDEPWMIDILKRLMKMKEDAFVDVGVNIGQTLIQVKAIDWERNYIGFEPNPSCVFYVENLLKINDFPNCLIVPVGLYSEDNIKVLDLYADDLTNSGGSIIENFRELRPENKVYRKIQIPVYSFDTIEERLSIPKLGILKVDVEGAEYDVLQSLEHRIKKDRPIILVEILPVYNESYTFRLESQNEIEALLSKLGYKMFRIIKNSNGKLSGITAVETIGIHSDLNACDYILVHDSEMPELKKSFPLIS